MNHSLKRLAARLLLVVAAAVPAVASASEGGYPLDRFPVEKLNDPAALQRGARTFVNYCLSCHSASAMRYNRLRDIGLDDAQIKANLMFTADKVGEPMRIAMRPDDAKLWFGVRPPDLSVIARARTSEAGSGADWLYTYLRSYYRDSGRATGWNNALFPNVGMPNALWQLQGTRTATLTEVRPEGEHGVMKTVMHFDTSGAVTETKEKVEGHAHDGTTYMLGEPTGGRQSRAEFDGTVADLVAYLTYMSDPTAKTRTRLGVWVLLYLGLLFVAAWYLNKVFWKDIH